MARLMYILELIQRKITMVPRLTPEGYHILRPVAWGLDWSIFVHFSTTFQASCVGFFGSYVVILCPNNKQSNKIAMTSNLAET